MDVVLRSALAGVREGEDLQVESKWLCARARQLTRLYQNPPPSRRVDTMVEWASYVTLSTDAPKLSTSRRVREGVTRKGGQRLFPKITMAKTW